MPKDSKQVYYEDYHGKIKILAKANPATFISMNDGDFAKDDTYVFYGKTPLPKANPTTWQKISHFYSKDDKRVYYQNKLIKEVDYNTFEVVLLTSPEGYKLPYGKDKTNIITVETLLAKMKPYTRLTSRYGMIKI